MDLDRFRLPLGWIVARMQGEAVHVPASDILRFLVATPWRKRGGRFIESVEEQDGFRAIRLRGHPGVLYWPKEMTLDGLKYVLVEQIEPDHWHNYLIPETRLEPGDVVADCGASEGLFSFLNHQRCQRVVVFEPNPRFLQSLARTFAGIGNVTIVPHALGARNGTASFHLDSLGSHLASGDGGYQVEVETLDAASAQLSLPFNFIKADLEGAELDFLDGAAETISAHRPRIAITTYHDPTHAEEIAKRLRRINPAYRIRWKGYARRHYPLMLHAWV